MQNIQFPITVELAGDSIWGYEGPMQVTVFGLVDEASIPDEDEYEHCRHVSVAHDATWNIYTDTGFERAISKLVGYDVQFTEQGMQQDEVASLEGELEL